MTHFYGCGSIISKLQSHKEETVKSLGVSGTHLIDYETMKD